MELKNQSVWTGIEDLTKSESFIELASQEFTDLPQLPSQENNGFTATRRDFLKYLGFSVGAATVAASCSTNYRKTHYQQ